MLKLTQTKEISRVVGQKNQDTKTKSLYTLKEKIGIQPPRENSHLLSTKITASFSSEVLASQSPLTTLL